MAKYRKKPVVIEAWQMTEESIDSLVIPDWLNAAWCKNSNEVGSLAPWDNDLSNNELAIVTLEGLQKVSMNDYIIQGIMGEIYPCRSDIFELTYEAVE